jgi:hypothetical protein
VTFSSRGVETSRVTALVAVLVLGSTIWVGVDASGRNWRRNRFCDRTWKWVVGCLFLWIVAFPVYLAQRGPVPTKS